ncbi:MAG: FAD-dependent oxidoreductase, partial [Clostridia bacterium]|nr:FAD-dependent oxidoreductase [Clostridia bacterium]
VAVVGGGDSALTEGMYLTRVTDGVTIIHRRDELRAAKEIQARAFKNPKIDWIWSTQVVAVEGDGAVRGLRLKDLKTGEESFLEVGGVFIYIGMVPNSEFLRGTVELDGRGYVVTDAALRTSAEAVWAVGEGCTAALEVEAYLARLDAGEAPEWRPAREEEGVPSQK